MSKHLLASVLVVIAFTTQFAMAHLSVYEPERLRNDNHFTAEPFAGRQVGECVPLANDPRGFFCDFRVEDDWSFENPMNVIDETRVPLPGLPGVPGFEVPCSLANDLSVGGNSDCPLPPLYPGGPPGFGGCVPLGPSTGTCDLSAGSPRPKASAVFFSTLVGPADVDVGVYEYLPTWGEVGLVAIAQVPACAENIHFFPTVTWAGPLGLTDARTGEHLFQPPESFDRIPDQILEGLPEGYGLRMTRPAEGYNPTPNDPRPGFHSGHGWDAWLYNRGTQIMPCGTDPEICATDPLSTHLLHNDYFHVAATAPVTLYALLWADKGVGDNRKQIADVSMAVGITDRFTPGDYAFLEIFGKAAGNGRSIHGTCSDPRATGKVDILLSEPPECFDAVDNDGDGWIDYDPRPGFGDPDCVRPTSEEGP